MNGNHISSPLPDTPFNFMDNGALWRNVFGNWSGQPQENHRNSLLNVLRRFSGFARPLMPYHVSYVVCYTGVRLRIDFAVSSRYFLQLNLCNPSDVMYGWVRNTWLHILPPYSFCCSSMVDLFELLKCIFDDVRKSIGHLSVCCDKIRSSTSPIAVCSYESLRYLIFPSSPKYYTKSVVVDIAPES